MLMPQPLPELMPMLALQLPLMLMPKPVDPTKQPPLHQLVPMPLPILMLMLELMLQLVLEPQPAPKLQLALMHPLVSARLLKPRLALKRLLVGLPLTGLPPQLEPVPERERQHQAGLSPRPGPEQQLTHQENQLRLRWRRDPLHLVVSS